VKTRSPLLAAETPERIYATLAAQIVMVAAGQTIGCVSVEPTVEVDRAFSREPKPAEQIEEVFFAHLLGRQLYRPAGIRRDPKSSTRSATTAGSTPPTS